MTKYKIEKNKLNISLGRLSSTKCKYCCQGPTYYFESANSKVFKEPSHMKKFRAPFKIRTDYFLRFDPSIFHDIYAFSFQTHFKSFLPRKHHIRVSDGEESRVMGCLSCECGRQLWYLKNKPIENRKEISQRMGKYAFTKVFLY